MLIRREMGVPASDGGSAQWSIDHLFLDQEGIPTIVELKRASDTRIRREVVGQTLDYAANAVRYWPIEDLRSEYAMRCSEDGLDPDACLREQVGADDPDDFWSHVRQNLEIGRVRLVFVADEIPSDLQRVIEFLNDQMKRSEVFGVEVHHYLSDTGLRTLVPRVIGQTAQSEVAKGKPHAVSYESAIGDAPEEAKELEQRLLEWATHEGFRSYPVKAAFRFDTEDGVRLFLLYPAANYVQFRLSTIKRVGMTAEADELLAALSRYAGASRTESTPESRVPTCSESGRISQRGSCRGTWRSVGRRTGSARQRRDLALCSRRRTERRLTSCQ